MSEVDVLRRIIEKAEARIAELERELDLARMGDTNANR